MVKTGQLSTKCKGDSHSSTMANIILSACLSLISND